jgi:hypothetical protein
VREAESTSRRTPAVGFCVQTRLISASRAKPQTQACNALLASDICANEPLSAQATVATRQTRAIERLNITAAGAPAKVTPAGNRSCSYGALRHHYQLDD